MAEELKKYKQILEWKDREFREVVEVELSTALSSESKKSKLQWGTFHCPFYSQFCKINIYLFFFSSNT